MRFLLMGTFFSMKAVSLEGAIPFRESALRSKHPFFFASVFPLWRMHWTKFPLSLIDCLHTGVFCMSVSPTTFPLHRSFGVPPQTLLAFRDHLISFFFLSTPWMIFFPHSKFLAAFPPKRTDPSKRRSPHPLFMKRVEPLFPRRGFPSCAAGFPTVAIGLRSH